MEIFSQSRERKRQRRAVAGLDRERRRPSGAHADHLRRIVLVTALATLVLFAYLLAALPE